MFLFVHDPLQFRTQVCSRVKPRDRYGHYKTLNLSEIVTISGADFDARLTPLSW